MVCPGPSVLPSLLLTLALATAPGARANAAASRQGGPPTSPAPGTWHTFQVTVSPASIAEAIGLSVPALPEGLLFDLIRVLHQNPIDPTSLATGRLGSLLARLRSPAADDRRGPGLNDLFLPLPIAPELWDAFILTKTPAASRALADAILTDRRAALLYVGLGSLDSQTLAAITQRPALLATIYQRHAGTLAAFGRSLRIERGIVRLPGPDRAHPAWERLVGRPASDPERFVPALLGRDRGRLAHFFDAMIRAGAGHQEWVAGPPSKPASQARSVDALYDVFRRASPEWDVELAPFYRPPADPADVLRAIAITESGSLAAPAARRFWERVWRKRSSDGSRDAGAGDAGDAAEPAWLVAKILEGGSRAAHGRAAQVAFAQRRLAGDTTRGAAAWSEAVGAFPRFPSLMWTLERVGVRRGETYARAARAAAALSARRSRQGDLAALAVFQGSLALVERAAWAQAIDGPTAERLVTTLMELDSAHPEYNAALARWLASTLIPVLADAPGGDASAPAEATILRALAGVRTQPEASAAATVIWEGSQFRLDVAAGRLARLQQHRRRQGSPTLDQVLAFHEAVEGLGGHPSPEAGRRASEALDVVASAVPHSDDTLALRDALERARQRVTQELAGRASGQVGANLYDECARARTIVLADVLTSLVYLPSLGDPLGQVRLGGHVARRHDFAGSPRTGDEADPAWRAPRELVSRDRGWHVEGALLGLDIALARLSLRRLDVDVVPPDPRLDETAGRRLAIEAAVARGSDVSDEEGRSIARALEAGRERVRRLRDEPGQLELETIAAALDLDPGRVQSLRWVLSRGASDVEARFSFGELVRLGAGSPIPVRFVTIPERECPPGASSCPRQLSELALRLIDALTDLRLPMALLPAVLGPATQDLIDRAQPMHVADEAALWRYARELPIDRIEDYVASLEGQGPLVLVPPGVQ